MRFDLDDDGMRLFCRILATFAGDTSAPWCVSKRWAFAPIDETAVLMYPENRIKPKHAYKMLDTTVALISAGYGGGTTETVMMSPCWYSDGKEGVGILLAPEIPDAEIERFHRMAREHGRAA